MVSELLTGSCDVAVQDSDFAAMIPLLQQLDAAGLVNLVVGPGDSGWQLDFGASPADQQRRGSFFADSRVRQGFAECIDRRAIVDQVTSGLGTVPDGFVPEAYPLFTGAQFAHWDYNPSAGRALLEEVGWLDQDEDGILEAERVDDVREGTPFVVTLLVPQDDDAASQAAQMIRSNMVDCGVRVNLENVFYDDLSIPGPDSPLYGRHFDLALTKWQAGDILRCDRYLSTEIPAEGRWDSINVSGYANSEYDTLCLQASASLPGTTVYQKRQEEVLTFLSDELPSLPLFMGARIALARPGIAGLTLDATSDSELWNIEELKLK